ncbi:hypothetical protein D9611_001369 [Ephemerocybe angulata]|uniref:C3H1-type domain-containing protein n=1 Tax=Ephemerocybe angulata TaxID=980116 RepID=A0A8H5CJY2_9AGAR|nr:hypothetical protein D9611_001367 [Tulosesus angulatus]KAF5342315.1 hypothetical protein D9611_001368 [Tulosesus angulatus]KAF5342316.1 hypothetical protein D9611_001369 [Tulosesus angulatus]
MYHGTHLPANQPSGSSGRNGGENGSENPTFVQGSSSGTTHRSGSSHLENSEGTLSFSNGTEDQLGSFARETVQKAEAVFEDVRQRNLEANVAVGRLFSIFDLDGEYTEAERAERRRGFEHFVDQIEEAQRVEKEAAREGKRIETALRFRPRPRNSRSRSPQSHRNGGSGENDGWSSPNGDTDPAISGGKRFRIRRDQLPWATRDDEYSSNITDASCLRNQELLRLFKLDVSFTLSDIELSPSAPLGFPESEWRKIIEGHAVNLNTVLGHLHFREAPESSSARLGDKELILPAAKGATRITDAGQWASAWDATSEAYEFVFEHRRRELREYGNQIRRLFAARLPHSANRIIDYDDAVRKYVKGGTAMRLTDTHRFAHLFDAYLSFDGIESQRREPTKKGKSGNFGGGGPTAGKGSGICDRYNDKGGCERADGKCRFRHVCSQCGKPGHGEPACKGGGGKAA